MTTDLAVRAAKARWQRRRYKLIGYGQWQPFVDPQPSRQHLLNLMEFGISIEQAAAVSGLYPAVLSGILYGHNGKPPRTKIRPETAAQILAVQPRFEYINDRHNIDGTATRRRLQALAAIGFPFRRLGEHLPLHPAQIGHTARSEKVQAGTHRAVAAAYKQLAHEDPTRYGIRPATVLKIQRLARANGWAPPIAWDEDTISDPEAQPDWTGACGTDRGYWMHRNQKLPMCQRCDDAHTAWLAEHAHMDGKQRNQLQFAARAAASTREADLADDARELMRVSGLDYQQAADRLRVTRQHLQQALVRHPEAIAA